MQIDKPVKQVVQQATMILPHFDCEVPILYLADGTAYAPVIALCEMLGLRADRHIKQWRKLVLWANACKLPLRMKSGKTCIVWCLHRGAFPFLYGCFNWSLVSPKRRMQLRQATDEWIELSNHAYQEMQAHYKEMRRFLFTFLTTYADTTLSLRRLGQQLNTLLDVNSRLRLDELVIQGISLIEQTTKHACSMLQDQASTPIVDVFKADSEGTIMEIFSLPLFPVVPHEEKEKLNELLEKLVHWYRDFTRFLQDHS
jgi:hypothetical protein